MNDVNKHTISTPTKGLNLDNITSQIVEGFYSLMMNGINQSTEHKYAVSNESSTVKLTTFKPGYYVIGTGVLMDNKCIVALVNPTTNFSEIGYFDIQVKSDLEEQIKLNQTISVQKTAEYLEQNQTTYTPLVYSTKANQYGYSASDYYSNISITGDPQDTPPVKPTPSVVCNGLMFDINYPVRNMVVKRDLFKTYVFFTDGNMEPRYLVLRDIDTTPYVDNSQRVSVGQCEEQQYLNELDIQKINIFSNNRQPIVDALEIVEQGSIPVGSVQFAIRYTDKVGNPISQVYNITNPVYITKDSYSKSYNSIEGSPIQLFSSKAVRLAVRNLDTKYDYYQLMIIEQVNGAKNYFAQGPISTEQTSILYTGNEQIKQKISLDEFYQVRPNIQAADALTEVDDRLVLYNITETVEPNLQRVTNNVKLTWSAAALPTQIVSKSYKDGVFAANHKGYMGGEVYPFSFQYVYDDGSESSLYHIPGRKLQPSDLKEDLSVLDFPQSTSCDDTTYPYWKLYDTSTVKITKQWQDIKDGKINNLIQSGKDKFVSDGVVKLTTFFNDGYFEFSGNPTNGEYVTITFRDNDTKSDTDFDFVFVNTLPTGTFYKTNIDNTSSYYILYGVINVLIGATDAETFENFGKAVDLYNEIFSYDMPVPYRQGTYNTYTISGASVSFSFVKRSTNNGYFVRLGTGSTSIFNETTASSCQGLSNQQTYLSNLIDNATINFKTNTVDPANILNSIVSNQSFYTDYPISYDLYDSANNLAYTIYEFTGEFYVTTTYEVEYNTSVPSIALLLKYVECNPITAYEGDFQYWESTEYYPCDTEVWGELAGTPIRHHKFPERYTVPHFQNLLDISDKYGLNYTFLHPFAVKVDHSSVLQSIKDSVEQGIISKKDASRIVGYKLYRGNRVNDASVIAKGLLYDVWEHNKKLSADTSQKFFYQNYPFNDLHADPFILTNNAHMSSLSDSQSIDYIKNSSNWIRPLNDGEFNNRFTLLSPDTSFWNIPLSGRLHVDMEVYGKAKGHYYPVFDHAKYRRLKNRAHIGSWGIAGTLATLDNLTIGTTVNIKAGQILPETVQLQESIQKLLELGTPLRQYVYQYNGVGEYNRCILNPVKGQLWRDIDIATYLDRDIVNVGDVNQFNNFNRESSMYLKLNNNIRSTTIKDNSRYKPSELKINPEDFTQRDISSYYVSIKRQLPDQYGQVHSIDYCYTGQMWFINQQLFQNLNSITPNTTKSVISNTTEYNDSVFGGDVYITKFASIRSHSYFVDNRKGFVNDSGQGVSVNYSQLSNVGYPAYFLDTEFTGFVSDNNEISESQAEIFEQYATEQQNDLDSTTKTGDNVQTSGLRKTFKKMKLAIKSMLTSLINPAREVLDYSETDQSNIIGQQGIMYLASIGIPTFYVESVINTEMRHSGENYDEDFYPRISSDVPDTFLVRKPLDKDNTYLYNRDFSNQNVDNVAFPMSINYSPRDNKKYYANRAVWSQKGSIEETLHNYALFRVNDYKDFNTKITSIAGVSGGKTVVTFPNKTHIYNAYSTIDSNNNTKALYFGTGDLFENGQSLVDSVTGYSGSQVKQFLSCEVGSFWVDNIRGAIFSFTDTLSEISLSNKEWFRKYLPFQIIKHFPNCKIDNTYHYNKVGMTIGYDNTFNRVLFTKHDYIPLINGITYNETSHRFYVNNKEVFLEDTNYFRNVSFTISYDAHMKEWSSFHSYKPSTYLHNQNKFLSILNNRTYIHNIQDKSYQIVYGKLEPFIVETPIFNGTTDMLQYVESYTTVYEKTLKGTIQVFDKFYNKAIVHNKYQTTGLLNLVYKDETNDDLAITHPFRRIDSTDILYSNKDNVYTFNHIWNILKQQKEVFIPNTKDLIIRDLNLTQSDYSIDQDQMDRIRGKECFVRLIQDYTDKYQLITVFNTNHSQPSVY